MKSECRCTQGHSIIYEWFGEPFERLPHETEEHAVARWFASRAANTELSWGFLSPKRFDKYRMQLEAFLEQKLMRLAAGKLTPGTEVIPLAKAQQQGLPMFEFRWHREARQLDHSKKDQIRHYDSEPTDMPTHSFGLHMHLKDIRSSDDDLIAKQQNDHINIAIERHKANSANHWRRENT